jgi:DNA-binding MarR family transcriptional regulator
VDSTAEADYLAKAMHESCLGARVLRLHRVITRIYMHALRSLDLSLPQLEILAELRFAGRPMRPAELAETLMVERSSLSRSLAVMQRRGWLASVQTSPTGRAMTVEVSDEGTAVLGSAARAWNAAQDAVTETLGPSSRGTLDEWLARLAEGEPAD